MKCFRASVLNGSVSNQTFPFLPEKRKRKYPNPEVLYPLFYTNAATVSLHLFNVYHCFGILDENNSLCPLGVLPFELTFARYEALLKQSSFFVSYAGSLRLTQSLSKRKLRRIEMQCFSTEFRKVMTRIGGGCIGCTQ